MGLMGGWRLMPISHIRPIIPRLPILPIAVDGRVEMPLAERFQRPVVVILLYRVYVGHAIATVYIPDKAIAYCVARRLRTSSLRRLR